MKKHKSVVSILLAIMMVFTFMPTLAFADAGDGIAPTWVEAGHRWDKGTVTKKASSCYDYTLTEYKCEGVYDKEDPDHLDCGASYVEIDYKGHDFGTDKPNYKNVSAADFLAQIEKQAPGRYKDYAIRIYANQYCYAIVPVCKTCGIFDLSDVTWFTHEPVNGTKACAETYKCKFCGGTFVNFDAEDHTYGDAKEKGNYCSSVDLTVEDGGYKVFTETCSVCGYVHTFSEAAVESDGVALNVEHDGIGTAVTPAQGQEAYYVQYNGKYYAPNVVVEEPTCTAEGVAALVCSKDGQVVGQCAIAAKGHKYETKTVAATCEEPGFTLTICTDCGAVKEYTVGEDAKGHSYKVTVLAEPTCFADGISIAQCETCGVMEILNLSDNIDRETPAGSTEEKVYYTGYNDELEKTATADKRIEVADWTHKTHDYGKYEDMKEATCEKGVLQARKCAVCGNYDVHNTVETGQATGHQWVKTTQDPTCGAKGFEYEVCAVCGRYNDETYKEFGAPVVAFGTKCKFDKWVVETPATPFEEGTKKLVCSVCGDDGHLAIEGGRVKEMGVTRTSIAKTKIAAPAVKAGKKKATVTVKAVSGAVKYQIKVNGKVKKTVKKAGKVTIKKLKGGKKAKFQIVAINADGVKAASKVKSVKIKK